VRKKGEDRMNESIIKKEAIKEQQRRMDNYYKNKEKANKNYKEVK